MPDAVRAPPTAQALLPEPYAGSRESSASSAPSTARARWCQSLAGTLAKSRCWAWKTASGVHGSHGAGSMPSRSSSGASACSPAFTPSTYAVTKARVSSPSAVERAPGGVDDPGLPRPGVPGQLRLRRAPRRRCRWPGGAGTPAARRGRARWPSPARGRGRARRWPGRAGRRTRRGRSGPRSDPMRGRLSSVETTQFAGFQLSRPAVRASRLSERQPGMCPKWPRWKSS